MNSPIISTSHLTYAYASEVNTLANINLQVNRGDIYGFLGPNGSGKTTTLSLLLGLLKNQQGTINVLGKNLQTHRVEILSKVGSLIESPSLYNHLTAIENLEVYRSIYGASKARLQEVLHMVGLSDTGNKSVKHFSLGMKQRLAIALALLPEPELLILDEPTNGLDPAGILELRNLIKRLNKQEGITFLISSHILSEMEKVVNQIGIIYKGQMKFQGSLNELHQLPGRQSHVLLDTSNNLRACEILKTLHAKIQDECVMIPCTARKQVAALNRLLVENNIDVYSLHPQKQTLENIFLNLTAN